MAQLDQVPFGAHIEETCGTWLRQLSTILERKSFGELDTLFVRDCYWRDLVSFTWNIKTMEGCEAISQMLLETLPHVAPHSWELQGNPTVKDGIVEAWITFETKHVHGKGFVRLREGKCWTMLTTAQSLIGHVERTGYFRPSGLRHETKRTLNEERKGRLGYSEKPFVLVIGGSQAGLALAARLKMLEVPTIVLDKNSSAGDSWRHRYNSLVLHHSVWYIHLPYVPFPSHWPTFTPKDMMADWLDSYVKIMDLDYWANTACESATYSTTRKEWDVRVCVGGRDMVLNPKHLVFATGLSGSPVIPEVPGMCKFRGETVHSSKHKGGVRCKGKKVVIIGSNNSAHDIAADLWNSSARQVTIVQRSPTTLMLRESLQKAFLEDLYSEDALSKGITTEIADLLFASVPYRVMPVMHSHGVVKVRREDQEFYERLQNAGLALDFGEDDSGLLMKYIRRASGYIVDFGTSELIANHTITVQQGQIRAMSPTGVILDGGSEIEADLVVFATGFSTMGGAVTQTVGPEVAEKVGKVWGLGSDTVKDPGPWEGELRNMWKPTQQEALWFHGGNLQESRHYSKFLAIQLKARHVGLGCSVYGLQETFHSY